MFTSTKPVHAQPATARGLWFLGRLCTSVVGISLTLSPALADESDPITKPVIAEKKKASAGGKKRAAGAGSAIAKSEGAAGPEAMPKEGEQLLPPPPSPTETPPPADPSVVPELSSLPDPNLAPAEEGRTTQRRKGAPEAAEEPGMVGDEPAEGSTSKPESFSVPGFYGQPAAQFTAGAGRLALPKFRTSLSLALGYDDNPQTQTQSSEGNSQGGSGFASLDLSTSFQKARHREIFVWDAHVGGRFYTQNVDPSYDISLGLAYQRRFVRPFTLSANVGVSYTNQNQYGEQGFVRERKGEESNGSSGNLAAHANLVFNASWSPQFSTSSTLAIDANLYGGSRGQNDEVRFTFGQDFRYRVDRYTWIADVRYESSTHQNNGSAGGNSPASDSDTIYLLLGAEWHLGPWISISTRLGESLRTYTEGGTTADPYGELAISFNPDIQNSFTLSARYGAETNAAGEGDSTTFRAALSYGRVFTSRLRGSLSISYSDSGGTIDASSTGSDSFGGERIFDATLAFNYRLSSRLSLSASGTCTRGSGGNSNGLSDPDRNSVQVGAIYQF